MRREQPQQILDVETYPNVTGGTSAASERLHLVFTRVSQGDLGTPWLLYNHAWEEGRRIVFVFSAANRHFEGLQELT